MRIDWRSILLVALALLATPELAPAAESRTGVAVAAFDTRAVPDSDIPDFALLLAKRFLAAGVDPVVDPQNLGAPAEARPEAQAVQAWASRSGVAGIVVGSVTRLGARYSIDAQLRSGSDGAVVGTYVTETSAGDEAGGALTELADQMLADLRTLDATVPAPVAAAASSRSENGSGASGGGTLFSTSNGPIRIDSEQLEFDQSDGQRHFIFTDDVVATQDDVRLTSDRLDAYYPPGQSNPEKLVATGNVLMTREVGAARCREMTYLREEQRVICIGEPAELCQKKGQKVDWTRGPRIDWDLETDKIFVKNRGNGRVSAMIGGESGSCP